MQPRPTAPSALHKYCQTGTYVQNLIVINMSRCVTYVLIYGHAYNFSSDYVINSPINNLPHLNVILKLNTTRWDENDYTKIVLQNQGSATISESKSNLSATTSNYQEMTAMTSKLLYDDMVTENISKLLKNLIRKKEVTQKWDITTVVCHAIAKCDW